MRRKSLKIVSWYAIFMVAVTVAYLNYRERYGDPKYLFVEPKYEARTGVPTFQYIPTIVETPKPDQPYFVGDSVVYVAEAYPKAVFPGRTARGIAYKVNDIPRVDYPFDIVVMAGMADLRRGTQESEIDRSLEQLREALHDRFPDCSITIIHPTEIYKLATIHGADKWHLDEKGFAILARRYPILQASIQ